jgi:hypothetical protein
MAAAEDPPRALRGGEADSISIWIPLTPKYVAMANIRPRGWLKGAVSSGKEMLSKPAELTFTCPETPGRIRTRVLRLIAALTVQGLRRLNGKWNVLISRVPPISIRQGADASIGADFKIFR